MIRGPDPPVPGEEPTEESDRSTLLSPPPDSSCEESDRSTLLSPPPDFSCEGSDHATLLSPPPDFSCEEDTVGRLCEVFDTFPDDFAFAARASGPEAYRSELPTLPEDNVIQPLADEQEEHHDTEPAPPPDGSEPK